jgi:hydrogenase expression/formation protein HypE
VGTYPDGAGGEHAAGPGREEHAVGINGEGLERGIGARPAADGIRAGDVIIVSGDLGRHHAAILSERMEVENSIESDCALLTPLVAALAGAGIEVHAMRDITRGGLGTVLNELAASSGVSIEIEKAQIPVSPEVKAFAGIMGLDPLYMGNEGRMVLAVKEEDAQRALDVLRGFEIGKDATAIGAATSLAGGSGSADGGSTPAVVMRTAIGGLARVSPLYGEGLPRIC